jgi:hypothetical protein
MKSSVLSLVWGEKEVERRGERGQEGTGGTLGYISCYRGLPFMGKHSQCARRHNDGGGCLPAVYAARHNAGGLPQICGPPILRPKTSSVS